MRYAQATRTAISGQLSAVSRQPKAQPWPVATLREREQPSAKWHRPQPL
ncbi:MAG: hypothetical protein F6K53_40445 [Moorea sp. SIO4A1]|nr:hypothetical protein [Moorena sp. SIO4A1]NEQ63276.1 hypothetical protein [Moorena sp. SIO4A1]